MGLHISCIKSVDVSDSVYDLHKKEKGREKKKGNKSSSGEASQHVTSTSEPEVLPIVEELGHVEVDDEWSDDAFQDLVGDLSEWTADVLYSFSSVLSDFTLQTRVATDLSATSDYTVPVRDVADCSVDFPQVPVCAISDCRVDVSHASVGPTVDTVSPQFEDCEIIEINSSSYGIVRKIGEGGFGSVYSGIRLTDGLKVALKFADKENIEWMDIEGYPDPVPQEIGLMILANRGPRVPEIIQLLDWEEQPDHYIMVLERPTPCEDLIDFLNRHGGTITEDLALVIMQQAALAALLCCERGVLHRDIKLENLLINPNTLEVKLIDFGCGEILTNEAYTCFAGTKQYCPPEYDENGEYHGEPATVWSLGMLQFELLCGRFPESEDLEELNNRIWRKDGLSQECCKFLCSLLQRNPETRLELADVCLHNWFRYFYSQPEDMEIIGGFHRRSVY